MDPEGRRRDPAGEGGTDTSQDPVTLPQTQKGGKGCMVAILVCAALFGCCLFSPKDKDTSRNLTAIVRLVDGVQFRIDNLDNFDWHVVELTINDKYKSEFGTIPAGTYSTVGALNLADKNGNRFNPVTMKALKALVNATEGYYYGTWD